MAFQLKQLVLCLLGMWIMLFSHAKAKLCKCPVSDQDRTSNHTIDADASDFYVIEKESGLVRAVGVNFLRNLSDFEQKKIPVLSTIDQGIRIWQVRPGGLGVDEASFSVAIVYQPLTKTNQSRSGLTFLILPGEALEFLDNYGANDLGLQDDGVINLQGTSHHATVHGSSVYVTIGKLGALESSSSWSRIDDHVLAVDINIVAASIFNLNDYSVWIDYHRVERRLSVYVDVGGHPKPDNSIAELYINISIDTENYVKFGLLSTVVQQLSVSHWNATVEELPYYPDKVGNKGGGFHSGKVIIVSSVLGSIAATTVMATVVACYFNSRYRRWHKDLDQLARSMESLPGMPTKVEFADIKKATGNFDEAMKLGGGGFGTVYRCTLPAAASKADQPMDVAVKRFTRDVPNRRYNDFIAEVSIINRLRHKNIVPLIGWSYNKGEPLIVFAYMTNGSLDQHLFSKGGGSSSTGQQRTCATILRWATRYEIVRDIATSLHYVHHEYEPMVLHRDIKASNVMLDSSFRARLGDFGIACTVAVDRSSATGFGGTWGYIAPEYAMCGKATRQTDIYALGVVILEIVTGQRALADHQVMDDDEIHISDRVWRFHREGTLRECVDAALIIPSSPEEDEPLEAGGEAERLLLLGLACSNPNPSDRPTMPDVVRIIAKSAPPPEVPPHKPRFLWPPREEGYSVGSYHDSAGTSIMCYLDKSTTSRGEVQAQVGFKQLVVQARAARGHAPFQLDQSV